MKNNYLTCQQIVCTLVVVFFLRQKNYKSSYMVSQWAYIDTRSKVMFHELSFKLVERITVKSYKVIGYLREALEKDEKKNKKISWA